MARFSAPGICCGPYLVALGWAQPVIDFLLWMHFLKPMYVVDACQGSAALVLIGATTGIAYAQASFSAFSETDFRGSCATLA